jgi:hypothetical protein
VIVTRHQSGNCACSVLKLESVIYNKTQKRCAQVRVLIGSSCRELVAVALSFALENRCTGNRTGGSNPSSSVE